MCEREWPVSRARAWLSGHELDGSSGDSERMFRCRLATVLDFGPTAIDRAVAEVYGEVCGCGGDGCHGPSDNERHQCGGPREACAVPGCAECGAKAPTTPRPAEEIAREMVSDSGRIRIGYLHVDLERVCGATREARVILARLIERSRAEGAAAKQARVEELEAIVRSTRNALCLAGEAFERDDRGAVIHLLFEAEQALLKDRSASDRAGQAKAGGQQG